MIFGSCGLGVVWIMVCTLECICLIMWGSFGEFIECSCCRKPEFCRSLWLFVPFDFWFMNHLQADGKKKVLHKELELYLKLFFIPCLTWCCFFTISYTFLLLALDDAIILIEFVIYFCWNWDIDFRCCEKQAYGVFWVKILLSAGIEYSSNWISKGFEINTESPNVPFRS